MRITGTRRNERGATVVEMAIGLPIFFTLLIGSVDMARVAYEAVTIQFAVANIARTAILGGTAGQTATQRITDIKNRLKNSGLLLDVADTDIHICVAGAASCPPTSGSWPTDDPGQPEDWIVIGIVKNLKVFLGNYNIPVVAQALVRNEPF